MTRESIGGITLGDEEKVSAQQSLEMYPVGGAMVTMQEDRKGRLLPGMLADSAVLDGDPVDAASGELWDIQCTMTVLGGRLVCEA